MPGSAVRCAAAAALLLVAASPAAEEPAGRVVLRWQPVPGAAAYDLQVATDPAFARRVVEVRVELAGHRLGAPVPERRYWRVRTVDADGRPGPWSSSRVIEGAARAEEPVEPAEPVLLDVPPVAPRAVGDAASVEAERRAGGGGLAPTELPDAGPSRPPSLELEGLRFADVLRECRPGVLAGWRWNLLAVDAPTLEVEGACPLPWLGARWGAALRAGWWRERASFPSAGALGTTEATADVVPLAVLLHHSFGTRWARLYAGAGLGVDLVVVRFGERGALEASAAARLVAGAGRPVGPGEAFAEIAGTVGGVDGPLARLRTGGIGLSVGYRLRP